MICTRLAIALATISTTALSAQAKATDTTIVAYARVERAPPDFIHKEITPELAATECTTPQEDMECTTAN